MHRDTDGNADRHDDQADAEYRINLADDLVDGNERRDKVVAENNCQPDSGLCERSADAFLGEKLHDQAGRADCEDGTDHDEKHDREDTHDGLHDRAKVDADDFGDRSAVVPLGKHAGKEVMNRTGENRSEGDPQENDRTPLSALHGAEDRAEAGNVQQLDHEELPCGKHNIVDAVVDGYRRGLPVIRCKCRVNKFAVRKVTHNQYCETDQKAYHTIAPFVY